MATVSKSSLIIDSSQSGTASQNTGVFSISINASGYGILQILALSGTVTLTMNGVTVTPTVGATYYLGASCAVSAAGGGTIGFSSVAFKNS